MSSFQAIFQFDSALFWATVGVLLLVVEILMIGGFYVSFSIAAFLLAGLIALDAAPASALWKGVIFAGLGVAFIPPLRFWIRRRLDRTPDINRY